jgi:DNA-binding HxlR family transcriptional regulator
MRRKMKTSFGCPSEFTLAVLGGKWKTILLCYLKQRPYRYAELRKLVPALSDKMLTERLSELVAFGLVAHKTNSTGGGASVYALTKNAQSLRPILQMLYQWGRTHAESFGVKVEEPLNRLD